jgi:hypothetical protein
MQHHQGLRKQVDKKSHPLPDGHAFPFDKSSKGGLSLNSARQTGQLQKYPVIDFQHFGQLASRLFADGSTLVFHIGNVPSGNADISFSCTWVMSSL